MNLRFFMFFLHLWTKSSPTKHPFRWNQGRSNDFRNHSMIPSVANTCSCSPAFLLHHRCWLRQAMPWGFQWFSNLGSLKGSFDYFEYLTMEHNRGKEKQKRNVFSFFCNFLRFLSCLKTQTCLDLWIEQLCKPTAVNFSAFQGGFRESLPGLTRQTPRHSLGLWKRIQAGGFLKPERPCEC